MNEQYLSERTISMRDIYAIVFTRMKLIVVTFLAVVIASMFTTYFLLSEKYETEATIILNTSDLIVPIADAPPISDFEKLTAFHTQKDIIKSSTVVAVVVDELDLGNKRVLSNIEKIKLFVKNIRRTIGNILNIESWKREHDSTAASVDAIIKNIKIQTSPESKAISVSYRAGNPVEAKETLVAVLDEYKRYFHKQIEKRANGVTKYLNMRVDEIKSDLFNIERSLVDLKANTRLELDSNMSEGLTSESLAGIADTEAVASELKVYVMTLEEELRRKTSDLSADQPEVVKIRNKLKKYVDILNNIPLKKLDAHRLQRELDLKQEAYLFVAKNLEKARMVEAGSTSMINIIEILEHPAVNLKAVSPKPRIIFVVSIILGFLMGGMFALIYNYLDHSYRSVDEIENTLNIKFLASISKDAS